MTQGMFLVQADGSLVELREEAYNAETVLQDLIAKYPGVLSGNKSSIENPSHWLLVKREMGIPATDVSGNRWSLDLLFLDQDAVPTLVEVKRSSDTRIRREVIGQLLEYAANAIVYWPMEKIKAEVEAIAGKENKDVDQLMQENFGEEYNISDYWKNVDTNLSGGRIRLIIVADEIPNELQRIVEFLERQMVQTEIYAIEVKQYVDVSKGIKTLVPRQLGIITPPPPPRPIWNEQKLVDVFNARKAQGEKTLALQMLEWAKQRTLRLAWSGGVDGGFYPMLDLGDGTHYTFNVRTGAKNGYIQLQFAQLTKPFDTMEQRRELANRIQGAVNQRFNDENLGKYPTIKLMNLDQVKVGKFLDVFDWYIDRCRSTLDPT